MSLANKKKGLTMKYENVKVGDEFILNHRYTKQIAKVQSVSPKRFVVGGYTFAKKDGYQVGGDVYSRTSIILCTDKNKELFRQHNLKLNLVRELEATKFKELPIETLEKIKELLAKE